jgi:hypothetical protein
MRDSRERHIDITFVAGRTPRRERFIAAAAGMLWEWRTDLRLLGAAATEDGGQSSLADARIVLNVHGDDALDFDWTGVVEAMASGCVVASETSVGYEPLVPGVHFLMAPYEHLAEQAVALAFDEPRRAAMAEAAYGVATTELSSPGSPKATRSGSPSVAGSRRKRRKVRSTSAKSVAHHRLLADLKIAYLSQRALTRSIEATISLIEHDDPDHVDTIATSVWPTFAADVSVAVSLFDNGRHLDDTVRSVISASGESGPRTELIIVDDHSIDGSRELAEALLAGIDWFPVMLVSRAANGGTAVARNVGFNAARARYVLHLTAGDMLYPTALRRLCDGLDAAPDDVVATYGMVEQFDTAGSLGLTGDLPWEMDHLLQGGFIDSIAMFRREAWSQLGGYVTPGEGVEDGWEEYDMWLSVADSGLRAELVGSIVGRRRQQHSAMLKINDVDTASSLVILRERHPRLPWQS